MEWGQRNDLALLIANLATSAGIFKGGESGRAIVPEDAGKSLLYEKIHSREMPPDKEDRLSDAEIKLVERWILSGALIDGDEKMAKDLLAIPSQHDVIPIILRRCAACHGRHQQLANLDLRSKSAMLTGGKSGPAIVPGKPEESLLIEKVSAGEMPPLGLSLSDEADRLTLIRRATFDLTGFATT